MSGSKDKNPGVASVNAVKDFGVCYERYFARSRIDNRLKTLTLECLVYPKHFFSNSFQATRKPNKCAV